MRRRIFLRLRRMGRWYCRGRTRCDVFENVDGVVTELGTVQNFKVVTEGQGAMSAGDLAAREEFHRKVARLYRAVSGATRDGARGAGSVEIDSRGVAGYSGGGKTIGCGGGCD